MDRSGHGPTADPSGVAMTVEAARRLLTAPGAPFETGDAVVAGRAMRVWRTGPASLKALLEAAAGFGEREFMIYEGERVSYLDFHRAVHALAARLARDGVSRGDRVAIAMRNLPEWPVAFFASAVLGAIATPLNAWWTSDELRYGLADSGAKVVVADEERLRRLELVLDGLPDLRRIYATRGAAAETGGWTALEDIIGRPADWRALTDESSPRVEIAPDDPAAIFYTSGTTGRPKGTVLSHRAAVANIPAGGFGAARAALRAGQPLPRPDPGAVAKTTLLPLPLFHVTACTAILCNIINQGGRAVLMYKWDADRALELIEQERINIVSGVAPMVWALIEHPRLHDHDLSSVDRVSWGGGPASPELARAVSAIFPRSTPASGWGMTEVGGVHTANSGPDYRRKPDSCGAPVGDYEIKVCNAAGATLPTGDVGELYARGCNVALGYWNRPDASAETFADGWVKTGDIARIDEEGFCYIVDRVTDMLIRGGENIYCQEVENALYQHPDVVEAAVVGIEHRTLGEEPGAVVVVSSGSHLRETELRSFVADRIAAFKAPARILFTVDPLPRNASGKVLKTELRALFNPIH